MTKENKKFIDKLIEDLKAQSDFKLMVIYIIDKMRDDESVKGEFEFYWRISKAILEDDNSLSYDEKEHFLAIHKACLEIYTFQ